MPITLREKVRVIMHLPESYTKVLVERTLGVGWAGYKRLYSSGETNTRFSDTPVLVKKEQ